MPPADTHPHTPFQQERVVVLDPSSHRTDLDVEFVENVRVLRKPFHAALQGLQGTIE